MRTRGRYVAVAVGGLPRADDVGAAGAKSVGKDKEKRNAKGGRGGEARVPLGTPRAHELVSCVEAARPTWRKQSACQQLASSAAAGEVDRVCGEPADEESVATCQAGRAVDEAVRAINWLHGVDYRPRPVHSSNEPAFRRTSEVHLEAQQRVEEAALMGFVGHSPIEISGTWSKPAPRQTSQKCTLSAQRPPTTKKRPSVHNADTNSVRTRGRPVCYRLL